MEDLILTIVVIIGVLITVNHVIYRMYKED